MRQILSPMPTPARASPAPNRALWAQSFPYVTVSSNRWKYCRSGESAARRRIISVRVVAALTSASTMRAPRDLSCAPLDRAHAERRRRGARFAVPEIEHRDGVAGPPVAEQGPHVLQPGD